MANNRMWLVNDRLRKRVLLAKYRPSAGWVSTVQVEQNLDAIFEEPELADNETLAYDFSEGSTDWRVVYESDDRPKPWFEYENVFGETGVLGVTFENKKDQRT